MSTICVNETDQNLLTASRFILSIPRIPETVYFVQTALLPSMSLQQITQPTPVVDYPLNGTKLTFEPLIITFPINESMSNYRAIQQWMLDIADPEDTDNRVEEQRQLFCDSRLVVMRERGSAVGTFVFKDMFPINLSDITFDVSSPDNPILATATFAYSIFYLE